MCELVELGEICNYSTSKITQKSVEDSSGEYPLYGASGLIKYIDFYTQGKLYIAIVKDGAGIGRTLLLPKFSSVTGTLGIISPKENIDVKFLYYAISNMNFAKYRSGATIPHVYYKDYRKEKLLLPNLDKQVRIGTVLFNLDEILLLKKQQLEKMNDLVQSRFNEIFGDPIENSKNWDVKRLIELSEKIVNGTTPKGGSEVYVNEGKMFLRSQNVWKNSLRLEGVVYISPEIHTKMKNSSLRKGDILITKTGRINTENSSLGRATLFLGDDDTANINGHVYLVRLKDNINVNRIFVINILISDKYRELIRKVCVGAIDKRQLNRRHIENFPIILPPLKLQNHFAKFVEQVEKTKKEIENSIEQLEILKKSLMQKYFG